MEKDTSNWKSLLKSRLAIKPPVESDPRQFSSRTKGSILFCLALIASTPGFSSTIYFPGLPDITSDLNAPSIATTLTAALFILAMGIAPVFWAALSDYLQIRRFLLLCSMLIFAAASIGSAFVNNIWALIVLRCVQSVGASCGQSVGAGSIADCYPVEERGTAFGKFFLGVFIGPLLGPIIGGFLIMSEWTWRATFWFCFAFALFNFLALFFFFRETFRIDEKFDVKLPTVSNTKEETQDTSSVQASSHTQNKKRINPFTPVILLRYSFISLASFISAIAFGCMFAVETIIPDLYETKYGFNSWQTGLSYLGAGIGNVLGSILNGYLSDRLLMRARRLRGGASVVEDRLTANLWPCVFFIIPFGLLLFGWSVQRGLSYWAAIVGFGIQNFGMNQVMTATSAYIVDAMPGNGASASATGNFLRMVFACILTIVANPMVQSLGAGWTCVLLTGLTYISAVALVILKWKGAAMRTKSGFGDQSS
ncbi:major facilitator superfamily domain-containing protein [Choanephora cucurbitarum]|nr:major facilitator superfamily domain-containing protein [Choanephora cucurbitarum]